MLTLSVVWRDRTKLLWLGAVREHIRGLNLLAITLEMILTTTMQKNMGRNWANVSKCCCFGTRLIKVLFIDIGKVVVKKAFLTNSVTDVPTVGQNFWNKVALTPSEPEVFRPSIWKIALFTSSSVTPLFHHLKFCLCNDGKDQLAISGCLVGVAIYKVS